MTAKTAIITTGFRFDKAPLHYSNGTVWLGAICQKYDQLPTAQLLTGGPDDHEAPAPTENPNGREPSGFLFGEKKKVMALSTEKLVTEMLPQRYEHAGVACRNATFDPRSMTRVPAASHQLAFTENCNWREVVLVRVMAPANGIGFPSESMIARLSLGEVKFG